MQKQQQIFIVLFLKIQRSRTSVVTEKIHRCRLNGGPMFKFTEAVSFVVNCETQQEIDEFWTKLSAGGQEQQCGWLKDKFGLSWQIVPAKLGEMMQSNDSQKAGRVMGEIMKMKKLDLNILEKAYHE